MLLKEESSDSFGEEFKIINSERRSKTFGSSFL